MGSDDSRSTATFARFCGTRARLQRVSDLRFATGWLVRIDQNSAIVKINETSNWSAGDELFIQAHGAGECLSFGCRVLSVSGEVISLRINGQAKVSSSNEKTRHLAVGMQCHVKLGWFQADMEVIDVSDTGIGIKTPVQVQKGESADLTLQTHFGEVMAKGIAKYCRKLPGNTEAFRIGFEIRTVDRLSEAKWRMALDAIAGLHTCDR